MPAIYLAPALTISVHLADATTASPSSKKTKKATEEPPTPLRRSTRSASSKPAPPPVAEKPKPIAVLKAKATEKEKTKTKPVEKRIENKKATPRKRAADFYSSDEGEESDGGWDKLHADEAKVAGKKGAKKAAVGKKDTGKKGGIAKKAKIDVAPTAKREEAKKLEQEEQKEKAATKKSKKAKAPVSDDEISLHSGSELEAENALNGKGSDSEQDSVDEEEDDQTTSLLKGFKSSDDEEPEDVVIAAVKSKEFRNLTIPDVKQKIAARSSKKVLSPLDTPPRFLLTIQN